MSKPTDKLDFAKSMQELEAIVQALESGEVNLDAALPKFERGMELATQLRKYLKTIQNKVEIIKQRFDDSASPPSQGPDQT